MAQETNAPIEMEPVRISRPAKDEQETRAMLTKSGAAKAFGLTRWQIDQAIQKGQLPFVKIASRLMIPAARARMMLGLVD